MILIRVQSISPRPQFKNFSRDTVPLRTKNIAAGSPTTLFGMYREPSQEISEYFSFTEESAVHFYEAPTLKAWL